MRTVAQGRPRGDVSLRQIFVLFCRIGMTSFGGGLSAWIYREVVTQRGWLGAEEFLGALTLGQILPGSNVVNLSIYVGYRMGGVAGSIVAVLALLAPPMVVIVLFASALHTTIQLPWAHRFLEGVAAGALGLSASVAVRNIRVGRSVPRWPLALVAAVFAAVGVLRWPLVPVALIAGAAGLVLSSRVSRDA
jgi:chromate transporter